MWHAWGEERCIHIFGGKTELPFGILKLMSEDDIKVDGGEIRLGSVELI